MYLTLNLEEFFSLSHPTLGTFLIFHVCGQFFENLKNFEVPGRKKNKVVVNLTGIILMYWTLNLDEIFFHLLTQHLEFF